MFGFGHQRLLRSGGPAIRSALLAAVGLLAAWQPAVAQPAANAEPFIFGSLLPLTGPASLFGPSMSTAVELAVAEINEAGGILGRRAAIVSGDDAGDPNLASQALQRELGQGARAIMGTGTSGVSLAILDKVIRARVVMCSGANTAPELTTYPDQGYYFRTSASNILQGSVLAQLPLEQGQTRVAVIGRGDTFGRGLADVIQRELQAAGADVVATVIYDPAQTNFDVEVQQVAAARPEGVVLIGYDERGKILRAMVERGIGPRQVGVYTTGTGGRDFWRAVDPNDPAVLTGMMSTTPERAGPGTFTERMMALQPRLTDLQYSAEQYDCVIITALGAIAANSVDPAVFKDRMAGVTSGEVACDSFRACAELLRAGRTIAYSGAAGPLRMSEIGEPTRATFTVYRFDERGAAQRARSVPVGVR